MHKIIYLIACALLFVGCTTTNYGTNTEFSQSTVIAQQATTQASVHAGSIEVYNQGVDIQTLYLDEPATVEFVNRIRSIAYYDNNDDATDDREYELDDRMETDLILSIPDLGYDETLYVHKPLVVYFPQGTYQAFIYPANSQDAVFVESTVTIVVR